MSVSGSTLTVVKSAPLTAGASPGAIVAGPGGNFWFTEFGAGRIGFVTPAVVLTENPVTLGASVGPNGLVYDAARNVLWFTEFSGSAIGRVTLSGATTVTAVDEFPLPTPSSGAFILTFGPDGNLWFTEALAQKIGRFVP